MGTTKRIENAERSKVTHQSQSHASLSINRIPSSSKSVQDTVCFSSSLHISNQHLMPKTLETQTTSYHPTKQTKSYLMVNNNSKSLKFTSSQHTHKPAWHHDHKPARHHHKGKLIQGGLTHTQGKTIKKTIHSIQGARGLQNKFLYCSRVNNPCQ